MSVTKIVPLTNVGLLSAAIERAHSRPLGLPGLVVMYGASGLGKSVGAAFAANLHRAYYVECRDTWSKKAFLQAILREMSIAPAQTLSQMVDQVAEQLSRSGRPLLIDDVQYLLEKAVANVLTDIYNASQGTIVLIGEERVPSSLAKLERLHNRVLYSVARLVSQRQRRKNVYGNSYRTLRRGRNRQIGFHIRRNKNALVKRSLHKRNVRRTLYGIRPALL